jgi:putative glycosyltransferase
MLVSVVATLYGTGAFLDEFYRRTVAAVSALAPDFEIIFVNDGSPDNALEKAIAIYERDPRVVVVDLSRNFGHHKAMMTGMSHARGEFIFLIDSDLEEPPEVLEQFYKRIRETGVDVVYGVQRTRRGGLLERFSGWIFYWLVDRLCEVNLPRNLATARLMTRRYVRSLIRHKEREVIIAGLWEITGFHQIAIEIEKQLPAKRSFYSFFAKIGLAVNFITSFSNAILYLILYLGLVISSLSFLVLASLVLRYVLFDHPPEGWTSVIASVWLFGGLSILFIGLVGIYVARIFVEVKRRPYTIVRALYRAGDQDARRATE